MRSLYCTVVVVVVVVHISFKKKITYKAIYLFINLAIKKKKKIEFDFFSRNLF